ncbi:type I-C CRISPR-associated protein Cas5 [Candidatus Roizmanbacteria bacterium]|nr:type I-C CRISPR-associated protein Cas5 [Candidatus Roizmanbacteria bacterium]
MAKKNSIEFKVWGRYALFTDPITRIGGEKCSYHIPTYEALKGIVKSIYWKPTLIWIIDEVRIMKRIQTQTKGTKPLKFSSGGNDLSIYTFLADVEYQVRAHFEWNMHRPELANDRIDGKHYTIAHRMLALGGRQDIFLGTRDCQGYVEPCEFGQESGHYDGEGPVTYSLMFHSFDYPDETGVAELHARFCRPVMNDGCIRFARPEECTISKFVRPMYAKEFGENQWRSVYEELSEIGG